MHIVISTNVRLHESIFLVILTHVHQHEPIFLSSLHAGGENAVKYVLKVYDIFSASSATNDNKLTHIIELSSPTIS